MRKTFLTALLTIVWFAASVSAADLDLGSVELPANVSKNGATLE